MNANVGGIDRAMRIVMGLGLLSLVFLVEDDTRWLGLLGLVPLMTGLLRTCPAYSLLGASTCVVDK